MQIPMQITFRDIEQSDAVETRVREQAEKLEEFYSRMTSCRVVVSSPHRQHHKGKLYAVSIDITVPGGEIVVNKEKGDDHAHEDVYVAIRDSFNAAKRQLEDFARKQRGDIKSHESPHHGRVARLFPEQDYGFIAAADGREIYFHRNSLVVGDFDKLEEGAEVRFVESEGESGPQASTVKLVGKHHIVE